MVAYSFNGSTLITVAPTVDTDAVSSLAFTSQYDVSAYITPPVLFGIDFDTTGAKIFLAQGRASSGFYVSSSPLIPPYDITSIGYQIGSANGTTGPTGSNVAGFAYAKDGSAFYSAFDSGLVYEWGTATPFDQGTMAYTAQFSPTITDALALSEDGTKFYTVANNSIYTYTLATPWRVANNSLLGNTSFAALTAGTITDLSLNVTGDQLVLLDSLGTVISLQLATPFVIASYIDRGTRATVPNAVGGAGKLANNGNDFYVGQTATSIIDRYAVTPRNFSNGIFVRSPYVTINGAVSIQITPASSMAIYRASKVIIGSSQVTIIPSSTLLHNIIPINNIILGSSNVNVTPSSALLSIISAIGNAQLSGFLTALSSNTGATTTLNGVNTQINSRGSYSPNTVNITKFNTLLTSGSGSIATLGGMNKAFSSTVSAPAYGTCALNSFSTGIISKGSIGSFDTVYCRGFLSQLTASTGAISSLDKFTTTLLSNGSMGAVANASLLSFNTELFSSVSTQDVGNARLRAPIISMLRGDVAITGFSTKILANNHLVVNNSVAYAVNIKSMETTSYTGYGFDYIVRLAGSYYGVKPNGLYLLEGSDDNGSPIDATIRTNETDFGTSHLKQVPYVYIDTESQTTLSTIVDNLFNASELSVFNGRRTQLSKGSKGRYWAFEIKNVNGGAMRVGAIEPNVNKLKRRV